MPTFIPAIEFDQQITWDIGNSVLYWYFVRGYSPSGGLPITIVIAAVDIFDLCDQLSSSGQIETVISVQKFIKPVRPTDVIAGELLGNNYNPNVLIDVPFSSVPNCIDISVAASSIEILMSVSVSNITFNSFSYSGAGSVNLYGSAVESNPGNVGFFLEDIDVSVSVFDLGNLALPEMNLPVLPSGAANIQTNCWCGLISPTVFVSNNFTQYKSNFANFLSRNGFKFPDPIVLTYKGHSWQSNLHFTGLGDIGTEKWDCLFEWACTDVLGGFDLNQYIWRFSALFRQNNNGQMSSTRLLFTFVPDPNCVSDNLSFAFSFDTQSETMIAPNKVIVDNVVNSDGALLFNNSYWAKNPNLNIVVSSPSDNAALSTQFDISPSFPTAPNFG